MNCEECGLLLRVQNSFPMGNSLAAHGVYEELLFP